MTGLGGSTPLHEITVSAENWLTALRVGRKQLGEEGGVPTGSSCAVAPTGKVTIMDPMARRVYVLNPDLEESLAPVAPSAPRIPADAAPQPQPTPALPSRPSKATVAYISPDQIPMSGGAVVAVAGTPAAAAPTPTAALADATEPAIMAPPQTPRAAAVPADATEPAIMAPPLSAPAAPPRPRGKAALKATMGYAPAEAAVQIEVDVGQPAAPPLAAAAVAPAARVAVPMPPPSPVAPPAPPAPAVVAPPPPAAPAPVPAPPASVVAPVAAVAPPTPTPAPALAAAQVPVALSPAAASAGLALLSQRDEEPSATSPLLYRERTFVVNAGTSADVAEELLRVQLAELQHALAARPAGKFLNIAIFDHRWAGRPQRPPLVALQWKDWKGAPEISRPASRASAPVAPLGRPAAMSGPPAQPAPAPAPAPAAAPPVGAVATPIPPGTPARPPSVRPPAGSRPPTGRQRLSTGEQDERLANVFEALQDLFFLSTPAEGLDFVARLVHETIPCEAISACLYDINTDEFRFVVLDGPGSEVLRGEALPASVGLFGICAHRVGEALLVEEVSHDPRYDAGVDGRLGIEAKNAMYMALHHEGRLLGALQLLNRVGQSQFSRSDANVIAYVGKQLAEFLHAARIAPDRKK